MSEGRLDIIRRVLSMDTSGNQVLVPAFASGRPGSGHRGLTGVPETWVRVPNKSTSGCLPWEETDRLGCCATLFGQRNSESEKARG